jgi:propanol-preferring alcohol dehydrogenase
MTRKRGTCALVGLPPGEFPMSIFDTVLNGITVRGSIVGTRLDLQEALDFAGDGKVKATISTDKLENINDIFSRMNKGDIQGRVVIDFEQAT